MQSNNFRGFSCNNRYNNNQNQGGGFQNFNQFNYQRNQNNNLLFSNSNSNNIPFANSLQNSNNNFPVRINPLSSFQINNSSSPQTRPTLIKKRLYVKLTQEEKGYFSNLFQLVDTQNMGKLKNKDAANFMKKSGLNKNILKNIFLIAQPKSKQFLERDEFYVALRLIALAQNNMPYNEQAIILNKPIPPLPNFNLKKDFLADGDTSFELRDDEKVKYKRIFDINKDGNNDNISAKKAIQMWRSTGATDNIIQKIADILKPNEIRGYLNLREFQVATHLINLSDRHEIPTQLPANLKKYLGRNDIIINNNNNNNNLLNFNLENGISNNNNNLNNQLAIHYGNNLFPNSNFNNNNNLNNNSNFNNNINFNNNNNFSNNNNFNNNYNNNINQNMILPNQNSNPNSIEALSQRNDILNNKINEARNKLNIILKEIDDMQKEQMNIKNQINMIKGNNSNISPNIPNININNNTNNININNNTNNINNSGNNNYNFNLNQSGIGPTKNIIGFDPVNLPQNKKENKNEEYEKLAQKKNALLDLMNKMNFDKLIINNNNKDENSNIKNLDIKDDIDSPPEKDIPPNNIPHLEQNSKANANKFDDKLLESQAFAPEKLAIDLSGADDFNLNFDPEENKPNDDKKKEINFGFDSPRENKKRSVDHKLSTISLGSEIKKIEQNDYPNFEETNNKINNANDSNMFHFEFGEENKKSERKQSIDKDTFNFNTTVNQKEGDEWDF